MSRRRGRYRTRDTALHVHWRLAADAVRWKEIFPTKAWSERINDLDPGTPNPFKEAERYRRGETSKTNVKKLIEILQAQEPQCALPTGNLVHYTPLLQHAIADLQAALAEEPPFRQISARRWECDCGQDFSRNPGRSHLSTDNHCGWHNCQRADEYLEWMRGRGYVEIDREAHELLKESGLLDGSETWTGTGFRFAKAEPADLAACAIQAEHGLVGPIRERASVAHERINSTRDRAMEAVTSRHHAERDRVLKHYVIGSLTDEDLATLERWRATATEWKMRSGRNND